MVSVVCFAFPINVRRPNILSANVQASAVYLSDGQPPRLQRPQLQPPPPAASGLSLYKTLYKNRIEQSIFEYTLEQNIFKRYSLNTGGISFTDPVPHSVSSSLCDGLTCSIVFWILYYFELSNYSMQTCYQACNQRSCLTTQCKPTCHRACHVKLPYANL